MTQTAAILWYEPITEALQDEAEATGDGKVFELGARFASLAIQTSGSFSATVKLEGSINGEDYHEIKGIDLNDGDGLTETGGTGVYVVPVVGIKRFKARISAYSSGKVTVRAVASALPVPVIPEPSN